jgi:hypothetical protein
MLASESGCEVRVLNGKTCTIQAAAMLCAKDLSFCVERSAVIFTPSSSINKLLKVISRFGKNL